MKKSVLTVLGVSALLVACGDGAGDAADKAAPQKGGKGTVQSYRADWLEKCRSEGESEAACACGFDRWAEGLSDPSDPSAVAAARVMSGKTESMEDIRASVAVMDGIAEAMSYCAGEYAEAPAASASGSPANDGASSGTTEGATAYVNEDLEYLEEIGPLNATVTMYNNAFWKSCTIRDGLSPDQCHCAWQGLMMATGGKDGEAERLAVYMAVAGEGDDSRFSPELMSEALQVTAVYAEKRQACFADLEE